MTKSENAQIAESVRVEDTPCPACGETALFIEYRPTHAKNVGTFSLSGFQAKVSVQEWPWLYCANCGVEASARYDGQDGAT